MKKVFLLLSLTLLLGACATMTPQGRIDANSEKFARLSAKHKASVLEGRIDRGMPQEAVLLAWGSPDSKFEGYDRSRRTERWDYIGTQPYFTSGFSMGYNDYHGYGYGRHFPYDYSMGHELVYVPYKRATVSFVNGKVDSWERLK